MTYRNVRNQRPLLRLWGRWPDNLTAVPRGWEPPLEYNNRGCPEDDCVIRNAGWCPKCKEKLAECTCIAVKDIFDEPEDDD